jgi:hypothetical protein
MYVEHLQFKAKKKLTQNVVTWFSLRGLWRSSAQLVELSLKKLLELTVQSMQHKTKCKLGSKVM